MTRRSPRHHDDDGQALVEFALVLPILMVILLGIFELARAYEYWNESTSYANTAARFLAVGKPYTNAGTAPNGATVCVTSSSYVVGGPITVVVKSNYAYLPFLANKIDVASAKISGSATIRVESTGATLPPVCS